MSDLPSIDQIFEHGRDRLERVYQELGDIRDWLRSDWSDRRHLTDAEVETKQIMLSEIFAAQRAVERAKSAGPTDAMPERFVTLEGDQES